MDRPEPPVTREAALAWARERATEPGAIEEVTHREFNDDMVSGGFAFAESEQRFHIVGHDGSYEVRVGGPPAAWAGFIESFWATSRHRNRPLPLTDLGVWQRAAVAAAASRSATVHELPADGRAGLATARDLDYADYVLIHLNRALSRREQYDEAAAVRVLAAADHLLAPPHERAWTHPCPICGRPAIGSQRYPRSVCDSCYPRTVDSQGRLITGYNTSLSGGFEAAYVGADGESDGTCREVTESGRCWIDGHECSIGEAHFGGVVVQLVAKG
jgi:hypothetical protein